MEEFAFLTIAILLLVVITVAVLAVAGLESCIRPLEAIHQDFPQWILKEGNEGLLFWRCR